MLVRARIETWPVSSLLLLGFLVIVSCSTSGTHWLSNRPERPEGPSHLLLPREPAAPRASARRVQSIGSARPDLAPEARLARIEAGKVHGNSLGTFRNTYYDFPAEARFSGPTTPLFNAQCRLIKEVPEAFHDAVCVQGSGFLETSVTVSFARRDCSCARVCPRTDQKICFDSLDPARFPWGRGASGRPITPLLTVAVDTEVIPLHTPIYIPEYDGMPRDFAGRSFHDGCFLPQDRGLRVKGKHIDVFTGDTRMTRLYNTKVPSNQGITVVLDHPRCQRDSNGS
jgi:3D (Asp-Asp-Asp) domain-containing protein